VVIPVHGFQELRNRQATHWRVLVTLAQNHGPNRESQPYLPACAVPR
jgi:hypothetical protein